jgi:gliding motility-associated-like protein
MKTHFFRFILFFLLLFGSNLSNSQTVVDLFKPGWTGSIGAEYLFWSPLGTKTQGWSANLYTSVDMTLNGLVTGSNTLNSLRWHTLFDDASNGDIIKYKGVDIYMYHYGNNTSFSPTTRPRDNANNLPTGAVLVYSGDVQFTVPVPGGSLCETYIKFSTPFQYDGSSSLVVYIEKKQANPTAIINDVIVGFLSDPNTSNVRHIGNFNSFSSTSNTQTSKKYRYAQIKFNDEVTTTCDGPLVPTCNTTFSYPSATFCKGTTDPIATKSPSNASGTFTSTLGLIIDPITGTINLAKSKPGNYTVTFEESLTCKPTKTITINETPVISDTSTTICSGNNFSIVPSNKIKDTVPANTTYTWTHTSNANVTGISDELTGTPSISALSLTNKLTSAQDVVYQVTPKAGACEGKPFTTTIKVNPTPVINDITTSICSGQKFDTIPSTSTPNVIPTGTTYTWTVSQPANISGASSESNPQTNIAQTLTNTSALPIDVEYTVTATSGLSTNECKSSTFKVTVKVSPKPAIPVFGTVQDPTCGADGTVTVTNYVQNPGTYIFVPSSSISIDGTGKITAPPGKYKFVVLNNGCKSDSSALLTMNNVPGKPVLTGANSLCVDSSLTLKAWKDSTFTTLSTVNSNVNVRWKSSLSNIATVDGTGIVKGVLGGTTVITFTDASNCTQQVTIQIAPKAQSGVASIDKDTICKTNTAAVSLAGYTTTASIQWQDSTAGVWNDILTEKLPTMNTPSALAAGDYFYRAVVKNGFCNQYDTSNVVKLVVIGLPVPTFVDTIQPTCTVATGGVTSNMQYAGVWTIKATDLSSVTKDTTATVVVNPFSLTIKGLKPGTYTFQVSNSKGCISNASASIVINTQPTIPAKPVLDGSVIYCASNSYTLDKIVFNPKPNPLASESIKYFDEKGVVITNPSLVTVKPNEKYKFVFNNGACDSKDTLKEKIPMDKGPTLASNGTNLSLTGICAVEKPTFNTLFAKLPSIDTSLYSFYITPDTLIKPINYLPNKTIIGSKGGNLQEFYYTFADKVNGCKNTVFAKLSFKLDEGPKNLSLNGTQTYCGFSNPKIVNLDKAVISKSNNNNTLVWYATNTSEVPLNDTVKLSAGTYYGAEKENPGCESVDRKQVVVIIENFGPTTVDPNNVYAFCKGSNKKVSDLPITPYSTTNFVWLDSYKKEIKDKTIALIQGTYYAAEFKNGCISDQSQAIDVKFDSPNISITPSKLPTCGIGNGAFKIVGAEDNFTYQWYKNNIALIDSTKSYITNLPFDYTVEYKVIVKDKNGCVDSAKTKFSDCEPPGIPHVITINNDGYNDVFKLHYETKYPKCKLSIFNRWGAMVYESKEPYKDDWDGKPNVAGTLGSGELPTGTYFYLIDKGDGSALESGYVELVK